VSARSLLAVVLGVMGFYFVVRTGMGTMSLVYLAYRATAHSPGTEAFILADGWREPVQVVAAVMPFVASLVVLANRWSLAGWLACRHHGENGRLSAHSLKCTGIVGIGSFLVLDALASLGVMLGTDDAWASPMDVYGRYLAADALRAGVGISLVSWGRLWRPPLDPAPAGGEGGPLAS
jgi:hypothetical protein